MTDTKTEREKRDWLRLPVVSAGAEYLAMGYLMRRNILAYKAPPLNEGYDLICIHPDSKHRTNLVKVQVKSRYASDCGQTFPVKRQSLPAFDFLIAVFLNIGAFGGKKDGSTGEREIDFYTLPVEMIDGLYDPKSQWQKVRLNKFSGDLEQYKNENGFELIAQKLGIPKPKKSRQQKIEECEIDRDDLHPSRRNDDR